MTGTTITTTQYEALLHMFKTGDKHEVEAAHRMALQNGGWAKPGNDLSVLNSLSEQAMHTGLNDGWNIVADEHLTEATTNARQDAAMDVARNSIYGVQTAPKQPDTPKTITLTFEQDAALYHALHLVEGRKDVMRILHSAMLASGGWTWHTCAALNDLSLEDMDTALFGNCTTTPKQPFQLTNHPNGAELTQPQIDAINGWFRQATNAGATPEDFVTRSQNNQWSGAMHVVNNIPNHTLVVALFIGVKPL